MTRLVYFVVEGSHDQAFLRRVLQATFRREHGLRHVEALEEMPHAWAKLKEALAKEDPDGNRLAVYGADGEPVSVAIAVAKSWQRLVSTLSADRKHLVERLDARIDAFAVLGDADDNPSARRRQISEELANEGLPLPGHDDVHTTPGGTRVGLYLAPGSGDAGILEHVLLELAAVAYPHVHGAAETYVDTVIRDLDLLGPADRKAISRPFGREKAQVGAITAVLAPERSLAVAIGEGQRSWISDRSLQESRRAGTLITFLRKVVAGSAVAPSSASHGEQDVAGGEVGR